MERQTGARALRSILEEVIPWVKQMVKEKKI